VVYDLKSLIRSSKRMNLTCPKFFIKKSPQSARRLSLTVVTLCIFLSAAVPGLAEPVRVNQVVQTLTSSQGAPDLKLNTLLTQDPATQGSTPPVGPRGDVPAQGSGQGKTEPIVSGVAITAEGQRLGVETVEEGEVEGTVCDCGEILIAGGAFPKWPLLFLAAVPLVFINECDHCDENPSSTPTPTPPSTPTPTPPPTSTPEPASLLLFGTGLVAAGAGLRRRYAKAKLVAQISAQEEE
jgi:hypothetical protein